MTKNKTSVSSRHEQDARFFHEALSQLGTERLSGGGMTPPFPAFSVRNQQASQDIHVLFMWRFHRGT